MARSGRYALIVAAAMFSGGFLGLAGWQVQRLGWKQDLVARVEQRLAAAPEAP
ncbi:SURF1 family cytochrome oxidase biogenesis protein, partial [Klebsiella pneumoniae]|uniref:SURF1 family cytochrome oxidase biogenesis protein n=1 Tax=Klebsiella pneumoniae TaxID=573 RepID=UPI00351DA206